MDDIDKILKRVTEICGARSDSAVAKELGVTPQAIGNTRRRGTIPYEKLCLFAEQHEVSLDYLLLGKGGESNGQGVEPQLLFWIGSHLEAEWKESKLHPLARGMRYYYTALLYNRILGIVPKELRDDSLPEELKEKALEEIRYIITIMSDMETDPVHPYLKQEK
ncbi:MAG: helix-turn-helix domain-containing protein [Candidatus Sedimenticola sp. (ex Thyasira tokunagai)]